MTVEVRLYGRLAALADRASPLEEAVRLITLPERATIADVLQALGVTPEEVSHLFLNGQYSGVRRRVRHGDRLGVFPREMGLLYRQYFPKVEA